MYFSGNGNYLLDLLNNQYNGWQTGGYQYPYNPIDYRNAGRYRRSRENRLRAIPKSRVLKRARRIKRDLYFASDILGRNNDPFEERYLDAPYINEEVDDLSDDDIRYLVNLLDNAERYEEDDGPVDEYAGPIYSPYADYLGSDFGDEAQFYIPKRQAGLTFVPGLKRSRDFYPYFEEPQSHFPAFVPQKRSMKDYTDAYRRLMKLAQELRAEPYYPEDEYDFGVGVLRGFPFLKISYLFFCIFFKYLITRQNNCDPKLNFNFGRVGNIEGKRRKRWLPAFFSFSHCVFKSLLSQGL